MNNPSFQNKTLPEHSDEPLSFGGAATLRDAPASKAGRFRIGDSVLGRYTIMGELGQGGMGVVYKCLDTIGGIEIALKALPPELSHNTLEMEDIRDNFQLVSRLSHPNIASIKTLERDAATGDYYLVMECVNGENLRAWMKRKRRSSVAGVADPGTDRPQRGRLQPVAGVADPGIPLADVLPILRQAAAALDYAHAEKIVHRDIKPGNVMVMANGTAKVLDFGLAAEIHTSMSRVSMAYRGTSGTGPYMAPEQWRGRQQGSAADQYALAVTAYEMLAGSLPFENADVSVLREAVLKETADPIPGLPRLAMAALCRALSKDPAERFASCADFVAALGGEKISTRRRGDRGGDGWDEATRRPASAKLRRGTRGGRKWLWAAALLVVALVGVFIIRRAESPAQESGEPIVESEEASVEPSQVASPVEDIADAVARESDSIPSAESSPPIQTSEDIVAVPEVPAALPELTKPPVADIAPAPVTQEEADEQRAAQTRELAVREKQQAVTAFREAKTKFESALTLGGAEAPELVLNTHGAVKWAQIQESLRNATEGDPAEGKRLYDEALVALPAAVAEATAAQAEADRLAAKKQQDDAADRLAAKKQQDDAAERERQEKQQAERAAKAKADQLAAQQQQEADRARQEKLRADAAAKAEVERRAAAQRQRAIDAALADARIAKNRREWQEVVEAAERVLRLESWNSEAVQLKTEATGKLKETKGRRIVMP